MLKFNTKAFTPTNGQLVILQFSAYTELPCGEFSSGDRVIGKFVEQNLCPGIIIAEKDAIALLFNQSRQSWVIALNKTNCHMAVVTGKLIKDVGMIDGCPIRVELTQTLKDQGNLIYSGTELPGYYRTSEFDSPIGKIETTGFYCPAKNLALPFGYDMDNHQWYLGFHTKAKCNVFIDLEEI